MKIWKKQKTWDRGKKMEFDGTGESRKLVVRLWSCEGIEIFETLSEVSLFRPVEKVLKHSSTH